MRQQARHSTNTRGEPHRMRLMDARTAAWPVGLVLLLVALGTWQADAGAPAPTAQAEAGRLESRAFGSLRLEVPRSWRTLERTDTHVTWGAADRRHLVTLASTEAAPDPLLSVVRELARESLRSIAGAQVVAGPTRLESDVLRRGDAFVLVELQVDDEAGRPLRVVQAWRRDSRAGIDVVATWTSRDGSWPADPRRIVPRTDSGPAR